MPKSYTRKQMMQWHKDVLTRDNWTCFNCEQYFGDEYYFNEKGINQYLCGDHIKTKGSHPELVLDVANGRTVCLPCHNSRHNGNI